MVQTFQFSTIALAPAVTFLPTCPSPCPPVPPSPQALTGVTNAVGLPSSRRNPRLLCRGCSQAQTDGQPGPSLANSQRSLGTTHPNDENGRNRLMYSMAGGVKTQPKTSRFPYDRFPQHVDPFWTFVNALGSPAPWEMAGREDEGRPAGGSGQGPRTPGFWSQQGHTCDLRQMGQALGHRVPLKKQEVGISCKSHYPLGQGALPSPAPPQTRLCLCKVSFFPHPRFI